MSKALSIHPRHAWIVGLVVDEAETQQDSQDVDHRDDDGNGRASNTNPVGDERRAEG